MPGSAMHEFQGCMGPRDDTKKPASRSSPFSISFMMSLPQWSGVYNSLHEALFWGQEVDMF